MDEKGIKMALTEADREILRALDKIVKELERLNTPKYNPAMVENIWSIPKACRSCSNHPTNGGSGICACTLPYQSGDYGITCTVSAGENVK